MVAVRQLEDNSFQLKCVTEHLNCPQAVIDIPTYCFGTQSVLDNNLFGRHPHMLEEEQSLLDSLLLSQWEDRMLRGHFRYDVTCHEIKVICGTRKFIAQLNGDWNTNCIQNSKEHKMCHQGDLFKFDWMKHQEELLFCIASSDKAYSELIPSAAVPNGAILIFINVNPVEYGHTFLVPCGFNSLHQVLSVGTLEMMARVAAEINNSFFRLFYDCPSPHASHLYFQACYFPDLLSVEVMPFDTIFDDDSGRIRISAITNYPIKTLLFETNCNVKIMVEVLVKISSFLLDENIPYNLLISDRGKKIFLFLQCPQSQALSVPCNLPSWECGGYFQLSSKQEFDQVSEADLLKHLSTFSLDDKGFAVVKELCCSIASNLVGGNQSTDWPCQIMS